MLHTPNLSNTSSNLCAAIQNVQLPRANTAERAQVFEELRALANDFSADSFETRLSAGRNATALVRQIGRAAMPFILSGLESEDPEVAYRFRRVAIDSRLFDSLLRDSDTTSRDLMWSLVKVRRRISEHGDTNEEILTQAARFTSIARRITPSDARAASTILEHAPQLLEAIGIEDPIWMRLCVNPWSNAPAHTLDGPSYTKDTASARLINTALGFHANHQGPTTQGTVISLLQGFAEQDPVAFRAHHKAFVFNLERLRLLNNPRIMDIWRRVGLPTESLRPEAP